MSRYDPRESLIIGKRARKAKPAYAQQLEVRNGRNGKYQLLVLGVKVTLSEDQLFDLAELLDGVCDEIEDKR